MRLTRRLSLPLIAAVFVAGCASPNNPLNMIAEMVDEVPTWTRAYEQPPASQAHALVRMSVVGQLRLIPGKACVDFKTPGSGAVISSTMSLLNNTSHHGRTQGMRGEGPAGYQSAELRLPAGVPSTLVYGAVWQDRAGYNRSCRVARSFVPVAGLQYQMKSAVDTVTGCGIELSLLDRGEVVPTEAAPLACESAASR